MVKITYIEHSGEQVSVEAAPGLSIMKAAVNADVAGIVAECGGNAACGTCRIYVDDAWRAKLPPPRQSEQEMLDYTGDATPGVRLSCQVVVSEDMDGLVVRLPKSQHS